MSSRFHYISIVFAGVVITMAAAVIFLQAQTVLATAETEVEKSVEFDLAEFSPLGEAGGMAMPASGCSVTHTRCTGYTGGGSRSDPVCNAWDSFQHDCTPPDTKNMGVNHVSPSNNSVYVQDTDVTFTGQTVNRGAAAFGGNDEVKMKVAYDFNQTNCGNASIEKNFLMRHFTGTFADEQKKNGSYTRDFDHTKTGKHCFAYYLTGFKGFTDSNSSNNITSWRAFQVNPPAPTNPSRTCAVDGRSVTIRWSAPANHNMFYVRMRNDSTGGTHVNWIEDHIGTSVTLPITPGHQYDWWVHTRGADAVWSSSVSQHNFRCYDTRADLSPAPVTIDNLNPSGRTYNIGQTVTMRSVVTNDGGLTSAAHSRRIRVDGAAGAFNVGRVPSAGGIAVGGSATIQGNHTFSTPGTYTVQGRVEANNGWSAFTADADSPSGNDLSAIRTFEVVGIDLDPDNPTKTGGANREGTKTHTFQGVMQNRGGLASGVYDFQFQIDYDSNGSIDETINPANGTSIPGNDSRTVSGSITTNMSAGTHRVRLNQNPVVANDTNTGNNISGWTSFTIAASPCEDEVDGPDADNLIDAADPACNTTTGTPGGGSCSPGSPGCSYCPTCGPNETDPAPELTFSVNPSAVDWGTGATANWDVLNANTCTASALPLHSDWNGGKSAVDGPHSDSIGALYQPTNFELQCTGEGGTVTRDVNVGINTVIGSTLCSTQPPTVTSDDTVVRAGDSARIEWSNIDDTSSCTLTGPGGVSESRTGCGPHFADVTPANSSTYTVTCDPLYPPLPDPNVRINVLPTIQET